MTDDTPTLKETLKSISPGCLVMVVLTVVTGVITGTVLALLEWL